MFGLSGSKSTSQSTGSSQSSGFSFGQSSSQQGSTSGSVSGGVSRAGSVDQASSSGQSQSTQQLAFEDVFARLFGDAQGVAANLDTSMLTQASNQLFAGGTDFLAGLGGDAGTAFLNDRLQGNNGVLDAQMGRLQADIGELFNEQLLPGITSDAVRGGQLGGGRQGVAQGLAAEAAAEAFSQGATGLLTQDQAQRDAIAQGVADRNIQGAQVGLAGLPGLLGIAQGGITAQTAPLQFLASILGDQTVLTQAGSTQESTSSGESFSNAMDFARAFAESFGLSQSTDMARNQSSSQTQSTSSSKSMGIGF